ncbi:GNAT family N-acetyltransferase [Paracoccus sp. TK19116]|uniref:GNAT family N-acetyltransferase n=1 Tax=Paracoccus albicereus TaxID=2922394 RepID=A0ABT1MR27_9RHOB|nr:GNAT family N-acetyltransferase [Paracoccus albicereus]MCQ0970762.1 GNAT family N-acetyltransferase [Paracoccus albicereus]
MNEGIRFRAAKRDDVPAIIAMLADDELGRGRETADDMTPYLAAFDAMEAEGGNCIIVADEKGVVVGCYQLTFITGLSLRAARRALIEGVRVAASHRGRRLGEAMMADAETRAKEAGCRLIQLTTNKTRIDAHRFYDRLGFSASHIGYKKTL